MQLLGMCTMQFALLTFTRFIFTFALVIFTTTRRDDLFSNWELKLFRSLVILPLFVNSHKGQREYIYFFFQTLSFAFREITNNFFFSSSLGYIVILCASFLFFLC